MILALAANAAPVQAAVEKAVNEFAARGFRSLGVARTDGDGAVAVSSACCRCPIRRARTPKATIATARADGRRASRWSPATRSPSRKEIAQPGRPGHEHPRRQPVRRRQAPRGRRSWPTPSRRPTASPRSFPSTSIHIVEVLQQHGHIVGMTGDGVNDAPALKKADAGIAVSGATDAARAAADIVLLTPGLSVIIDAIKESRKIFQRMNSYAIYRIAETIRVLLFMTLSILVFNFYPVTAVMIVLLALLNDGAILSIAYDHVHYSERPEAWNMRGVLGIATVLGVAGVVASFGLFYLGERVFAPRPRASIQTLMYLKLSVAGHLTIFVTRTRGPVLVDSRRRRSCWRPCSARRRWRR